MQHSVSVSRVTSVLQSCANASSTISDLGCDVMFFLFFHITSRSSNNISFLYAHKELGCFRLSLQLPPPLLLLLWAHQLLSYIRRKDSDASRVCRRGDRDEGACYLLFAYASSFLSSFLPSLLPSFLDCIRRFHASGCCLRTDGRTNGRNVILF